MSDGYSENVLAGCNVTPKAHYIFCHVEDFCNFHGVGLGVFSEQACESVHARFRDYAHYRLPAVTAPDFGSKLKDVVCDFNDLRID